MIKDTKMAIQWLYKENLEYSRLRADFWKAKIQRYEALLNKWEKGIFSKLLGKMRQKERIIKLKERIQECKKELVFWQGEIKHWEKKINASAGNTN